MPLQTPSPRQTPSRTLGWVSRTERLVQTGRVVSRSLLQVLQLGWEPIDVDFEVEYPLHGLHLKGPALPRSYAGNIPVDRHGHPNNTLFFWAFERQGADGGTLTVPANSSNTDPWIIWLQGG